jgi:hypothetical protein
MEARLMTRTPMRDRIFKFVTYDRALDWLRVGWIVAIPNAPMHHHHYGVTLEWLCDCKRVRPI